MRKGAKKKTAAKTETKAKGANSVVSKIANAPVDGCCPNCQTKAICRHRDFSEKALTALMVWEEINADAVGKAICDDCYDELREVLIDRADDIEIAAQEAKAGEVAKVRQVVGNIAS